MRFLRCLRRPESATLRGHVMLMKTGQWSVARVTGQSPPVGRQRFCEAETGGVRCVSTRRTLTGRWLKRFRSDFDFNHNHNHNHNLNLNLNLTPTSTSTARLETAATVAVSVSAFCSHCAYPRIGTTK